MAEQEASEEKKRRAVLREIAEAIQIVHYRRLAALTDAEAWRIMKSLAKPDGYVPQPRGWSELVEQQAIFHRRRMA